MAEEGESLNAVFSRAEKHYSKIVNYEVKPGSKEYRDLVTGALVDLERAWHLSISLSLFSPNETRDDLSTRSIRFLWIPCLLGNLIQHANIGERLHSLTQCKVLLEEFTEMCKSYRIVSKDPPLLEDPSTPAHMRVAMAARQMKLCKLKQKKELEEKIKILEQRAQQTTPGVPIDEEMQRELYFEKTLLLLHSSKEILSDVAMETKMLQDIAKVKEEKGEVPKPPPPPKSSGLPPLVLTRSMLRGRVFGAGYPSVPTVSLEEFFDQQYREMLQEQQKASQSEGMSSRRKTADEEEEEEDQASSEDDSEQALRKKRDWDSFKDDHKRGSGNRHNKG